MAAPIRSILSSRTNNINRSTIIRALLKPEIKHISGCSLRSPLLHGVLNNQRGYSCSHVSSSFAERSHLCGDLRASHEGQAVQLCGWIKHRRMGGAFLVLRDWRGTVQLNIPEHKLAESKSLALESVISVKGLVRLRPDGQGNKNMSTGEVEVKVEEMTVMNKCMPVLPFEVHNFHKVTESLRIKHRYLELRQPQLQKVLRLRSKFVLAVRNFLSEQHDFVEVETPTLFRRTPGGAREFIVPTHTPGRFYSLPQSPQQFKQLLMAGGLDRYFQIAKCYRDESTKPDRQPEFTQIDLELSFTTQDSVMSLVEQMLAAAWPQDCGMISAPFQRMSYEEAMLLYGTDKPDLRIPWKIADVTDVLKTCSLSYFQDTLTDSSFIQALRIPEGSKYMSNKNLDDTVSASTTAAKGKVKILYSKVKENGSLSGGLSRGLEGTSQQQLCDQLGLVPGDVVLVCVGDGCLPHTALGTARVSCANLLESKDVNVRSEGFHFLWVDNFPLFLPREDGEPGVESAHHPFTAPHPDDIDLVYESPEKVRGQHYDLVLNGNEIGGGSIRVHDSSLQRYILTDVLKEDSSQLEHLLEALDSGCPPHGGIALGLDRLITIMTGAETIRDVIAFPKITGGKDPLSSAPAPVAQSDLEYYHIALDKGISNDSSD